MSAADERPAVVVTADHAWRGLCTPGEELTVNGPERSRYRAFRAALDAELGPLVETVNRVEHDAPIEERIAQLEVLVRSHERAVDLLRLELEGIKRCTS